MQSCLIHHILAERKLAPPGMVFPVSSVMLDGIDAYRALHGHSGPLMPFIEWRPLPERNVEVLNQTAWTFVSSNELPVGGTVSGFLIEG